MKRADWGGMDVAEEHINSRKAGGCFMWVTGGVWGCSGSGM